VVAVAGLLLLGSTIVIARYLSRPPLSTQSSALVTQAEPTSALPLPDKPFIVVLPFVNMSEDPKQDYFSDGITEDLTSDLSKISSLFVIARNSAFTYKGKAAKVQDIIKELGVRYVLEGSVRKAADQVRVTAQLIDGTTGGHLWSERYDRELKDIFAVQDEIRQKIVLALKVKLTPEEQERFKQVPTDNLEAYELVLRGTESFLRITKEATAQARQMYEKAIELDPQYAGAYAALARTHFADWGLWFQGPQSLEQAFVLAQKAVALDDSLAYAHTILGSIYLRKKQPDQAIAEAEKAIIPDPNGAYGYAELAEMLTWVGRPEETIGLVEKAMRLDPQNAPYYSYALGHAYRLLRRYEEAIAAFKRCLSRNSNHVGCHTHLAATYSELGQEEEAWAEAAELLRLNPNFSLERFRQNLPYTDQAASERFIAALRKAGLK
jgi:adenylate cyclase